MIPKKVIICDLDGTLAVSKSTLTKKMAEVILKVLRSHNFCVVSGGAFPQFEKQFLSQLGSDGDVLQNLYLFPTMGTVCFTYSKDRKIWEKLYEEALSEGEREKIKNALKEAMDESGVDFSEHFGEIVEDRGTQITFSGKGQQAPVEVKEAWDKDRSKREKIRDLLLQKIPEFEIAVGGITSIDITRKGLDKSHAIEKIEEILKTDDMEMIFLGDALYPKGNDVAVKKTAVDFIQVDNPDQTLLVLEGFVA